ncbi:MAG: hypothetical protein KF687_14485 [Cyclobacteriaceae bacterium]|nr:hypothetical protein [Cyclobacteriaceae bacterium]
MIRNFIDSAAEGHQISEKKKRMMITVIALAWTAAILFSIPIIYKGLSAVSTYNEVTTEINNRPPDYYSRRIAVDYSNGCSFPSYGEFDCKYLVCGVDQQTCVKERIQEEFFGPIYKIAIPLLLFASLGIWLLMRVYFWIQSSEKPVS